MATNPSQRAPLLMMAVLAAIGAWSLWRQFDPIRLPQQTQTQVAAAQVSPIPFHSAVAPRASVTSKQIQTEDSWADFKKKFGSNLEADFLPDGRVAAIRAVPDRDQKKKASQFDPRDPKKIMDRARDVLDSARGLIGVEKDSPLGDARVRVGDLSAKVTFRESHEGLVVLPRGSVTVSFGAEGEILSLSSDYAQGISVRNQVRVDAETARSRALSALADMNSKATGGNLIIWQSGAVSLKAYEYWVQGRQIIVDAESGTVITIRDQSQT